jgi:hypothetical protein
LTYCDGVRASSEGLATHVCEETSDLVLVDLVELRVATLAGVHDVLPQEFLWDFTLVLLVCLLFLCFASGHLFLGKRQSLAVAGDTESLVVDEVTIGID